MYQDNLLRELVVDNFAGGGGASTGMELALGFPVDIAVNHDGDAIAMHKANHPYTQHFQEDVFAINPEVVTGGRPVGVAWFSPDCKHFSRAKGSKPVEKKIRGLSWVILRWAMSSAAPRVIFMENVPEIKTWCPLIEIDGQMRPDLRRVGETFDGFIAMLTTGIDKNHAAFAEACEFLNIAPDSAEGDKLAAGLGYEVDYKTLRACDYGAPTIRNRFYMIARRDGQPIVFPKPTHGKGLKPYRSAAECIDWTIPCPSIFGRKKDLAVNTQRRIARGLDKFVVRNPKPFILQMNFDNAPQDPFKPLSTQTTANHHYIVTPTIVPVGYGERKGQAPRVNDITEPLSTIVSCSKQSLVCPSLIQYHSETTDNEVRGQELKEPLYTIDTKPRYGVNACYISKYYGGDKQAGADIEAPMPTVTATDHNSVVAANLLHYYGGADRASKADSPLATITVKPRHFLVESHLCVLRKNMDCKSATEPLPTLTTSAGHMAQITTRLQKIDTSQPLGNWDKIRQLLNEYAGYSIAEDEILIFDVYGTKYYISDIGMRMLKARELMLAQGFPPDYIIDIEPFIGKKYSEAKQIARMGNAVCPPVATALVRANCADVAARVEIDTMSRLNEVINATCNVRSRYRRG